jgi:hypothetical protein
MYLPAFGSEMILFTREDKNTRTSYSYETFKCTDPDCGYVDNNETDPTKIMTQEINYHRQKKRYTTTNKSLEKEIESGI